MTQEIVIDEIAAETIEVPILGTSPLIVHAFDQKAKQQMLERQQGKKAVKVARDPFAEYEACFYYLKDGRYGFPTLAFKSATVGAARFYGRDVTMTSLRQQMFFHGEMGTDGRQMSAIEGDPEMREDTVVASNTAMLRYRPMFQEWSTTLTLTFVESSISRSSVLSLIDAGGLGVGVGDWRPQRSGDFGTYRVDPTRDVKVVER